VRYTYSIGELVHIPQAVTLVHHTEIEGDQGAQLCIPLRTEETAAPTVGIVTNHDRRPGYIRVYCEGSTWSVKEDRVFSLETREG
jgi:hypothetical protein